MKLDETIKIICIKRKTNIAELSTKLGNSKQNLYNKLYRNDMKISDLEKLAEALDCKLQINFIDKTTGEILN